MTPLRCRHCAALPPLRCHCLRFRSTDAAAAATAAVAAAVARCATTACAAASALPLSMPPPLRCRRNCAAATALPQLRCRNCAAACVRHCRRRCRRRCCRRPLRCAAAAASDAGRLISTTSLATQKRERPGRREKIRADLKKCNESWSIGRGRLARETLAINWRGL